MNKITREQVEKLFKPGDLVIVHYLKENLISAGIQFASKGTASHVLCSLGGMEVVEALIGGVSHSFLDNYLKGNCRLTIKRIRPPLDHREMAGVTMYWRSCIANPYDLWMIVHVALDFIPRRAIMPVFPPLGRFLLRALGRLSWASHTLSTCAELGARGVRIARPKFLKSYDPEDITPEVLLRDVASLETVAVVEGAFLAQGRK